MEMNCDLEPVFNKINKLNINQIVNQNQICTRDDYFVSGEDIYGMVFEPIIFDRFCMLRMNILTHIGYFNLKGISSDQHLELFSKIKDKFSTFVWVIVADPPNRIANQLADYSMIYHDTISNPDNSNSLFQTNKKYRHKFFHQLKKSKYTSYQIVPNVDPNSYYYVTLVHDAAILDELPKKYKTILERRREQRYWVSRILKEKKITNDLVPLICSFFVTGSKIYKYM